MAYTRSLGAAETTGSPVGLEVLAQLDQRTKLILEGQKRAERRWTWQTIAGIAGAAFAAVRLGIIALPTLQEHRKRRLASASSAIPVANPPRRRRRRRTRR